MHLRHPADRRTVLWTFLAAAVVALQYWRPALIPYLAWVSAYFALACGVIAHNHNHCPTFVSARANHIFGTWLSIFYGYPTFAWVPTHNLNHHRYVNRPGDATITWRVTNKHHLGMALSYFFVSAYWQGFLIKDFIRQAKQNNRPLYRRICAQYAFFLGSHAVLLTLAIALHGWLLGVGVWVASLGAPAFFALWTIMLFNYDQHAHTDAHSRWAHSRSFLSPTLNFLLFNNGYHFAHHEDARAHWTELPALHAKLAPHIHPSLQLKSLWGYWGKQYLLAPLFPRLGTVQLGAHPGETPAVKAAEATVSVSSPSPAAVAASPRDVAASLRSA
ncbi:MAG: fatty acid desaturase family protein [Polyangiales bacterium]